MIHRNYLFIYLLLCLTSINAGSIKSELAFDNYHQLNEVNKLLKFWSAKYPNLVKQIVIGKSAGKKELLVLRIAAQPGSGVDPDSRQAVFVSANIEGYHLVGTEAALMFIEKLLIRYGSDEKITYLLENKTVYVAPLLNPDAAESFFIEPRFERSTNNHPMDDDGDGLTDEDSPDDLNNDGLITQMRIKDPDGEWTPDSQKPRLMRKADSLNGERGIFKVLTEGLDNDSDGKYNEDALGGIIVNRNFPHDLQQTLLESGSLPAIGKETIAIVKFLMDFPNIALVLNFSLENTIFNLQQVEKSEAVYDKIKLPRNSAKFLRLNPEQDYSMQELVEIIKSKNILPTGAKVDEDIVKTSLDLTQTLSIDEEDSSFLEAIQKEYKEKLRKVGLNSSEKRIESINQSSFVGFCYFQFGVPVISSDLWTIPVPGELTKEEKLTSIEVTSSKRGFHPDFYNLEWADKTFGGAGFIEWIPFEHPTLGNVEIGGFAPFLKINPQPKEIERTISFDTDFYIDLLSHLAELKIKDITVKSIGDDLYNVVASFVNQGWFPTSTAQGRKAQTSLPITVRLKTTKNQMIYSGQPFQEIPFISERGEIKRLDWTIKGKKGSTVLLTASSPKTGSVKTIFELK